jgi:hypothetical protein
MYDNILYPTDGSKGAAAVLDHARDLAETYDATLHVLFVVDAEKSETGMVVRRGEDGDCMGSPRGAVGGPATRSVPGRAGRTWCCPTTDTRSAPRSVSGQSSRRLPGTGRSNPRRRRSREVGSHDSRTSYRGIP